MKGMISLLALCAFQTVFADLKKYLDDLREKTIANRNTIENKFKADADFAANDARYRGVGPDVLKCSPEYKNLEEFIDSDDWKSFLENCYNRPLQIYYHQRVLFKGEAFQYAEECYDEYMIAFEKEEQECRDRARKCIADHVEAVYGAGNGFVHERL